MEYQLLSDDRNPMDGGDDGAGTATPKKMGPKSNSFSGVLPTGNDDLSDATYRPRQGSMPPALGIMAETNIDAVDWASSDFGSSGPKAADKKGILKKQKQFRNRILLLVAAVLSIGIVVVIIVPKASRNNEPEDPREACVIPDKYFDTQLFAVDYSNYTADGGCRNDRTIDVLWKNNIFGGVLVQPSTTPDFNQDHMMEQLELFPERLRGVISFDPLTSSPLDAGLTTDRLEQLEQVGVRGIRWNIRNYNQNQRSSFHAALKTQSFLNLFEFMRARRWHLDVAQNGRHWPQLLPHLRETGVRLVIDNLGTPSSLKSNGLEAVLEAVKSSGRTWLRLSGARTLPLNEAEKKDLVQRISREVSLSSLLWGSAYSDPENEGFQFDYEDHLLEFRNWFPRFSHQLQILVKNPEDVYRFGE